MTPPAPIADQPPPVDLDEQPLATVVYYADAHDGPGWYFVIDDYPDEGSCGAFKTREDAAEFARSEGNRITGDDK